MAKRAFNQAKTGVTRCVYILHVFMCVLVCVCMAVSRYIQPRVIQLQVHVISLLMVDNDGTPDGKVMKVTTTNKKLRCRISMLGNFTDN